MVNIRPYTFLHYNTAKAARGARGLADVLCPPYDVVAPDLERRLKRNPRNFLHLELPSGTGEERYRGARDLLLRWKRQSLLVRDTAPCLYVHRCIFRDPGTGGAMLTRYGLMTLVGLDPSYRTILPHEQTKPKPVADRLRMLHALRVQTSAVFCLVEDPRRRFLARLASLCSERRPDMLARNTDGGSDAWFRVESPETVTWLTEFLRPRKLCIADGHHRYKTACLYHQRRPASDPDDPRNFFMAYVGSLADPGLLILPTHRGVSDPRMGALVDRYFVRREWDGRTPARLALYRDGKTWTLHLRTRSLARSIPLGDIACVMLDHTVLRDIPKEDIFYHQDRHRVIAWADACGGYAFLVEPVSPAAFRRVVSRGLLLPPKATYFHPKVVAGGVMFDHGE